MDVGAWGGGGEGGWEGGGKGVWGGEGGDGCGEGYKAFLYSNLYKTHHTLIK